MSDPEDPTADMFFVAYERTDVAEPARRPLTFFLNGGPGAASVWLHLGAAGPKRVVFRPDGRLPPPPARLDDNPYTWLRHSDLVFVDPVGTGFSRPRPGEDGKDAGDRDSGFFEVERDLDAIGALAAAASPGSARTRRPVSRSSRAGPPVSCWPASPACRG